MKKNVLLVAALLFAGTTFAQTESDVNSDVLTNDDGEAILPVAGDYGLGFDATNIFNFVGNMFNGTQNNSLDGLGLQNSQTIYGKYFVEDKKAYRGMLQLDFGTIKNRTVEDDLSSGASAGAIVEDEMKVSGTDVTLGAGIEYRRGNGRLQGVYGPIAMIGFSSGTDITYTYGNSLEDVYNFDRTDERTLEDNNGGSFSLLVGAFGGIEYFIAPKFSLGAEIMWTVGYTSTGNGEVTTETYMPAPEDETTTSTRENGGGSGFGVGTTPNTSISANFYF